MLDDAISASTAAAADWLVGWGASPLDSREITTVKVELELELFSRKLALIGRGAWAILARTHPWENRIAR